MKFLLMVIALMPQLCLSEEVLVGAGLRHRPVYDGAGEETTDLIPVLRYYGRPWFARTTQGILEGGARFATRGGLQAGVQLAYEQGPRDGDPGASAGVHLEYDTNIGPAPLNILARWRSHLDAERGGQADLRATVGVLERGGLRAGVFGQATWANEKHLREFYGVSDAGGLFASLGVLGSYDISRRWVAVASAEARRLGDAPARGPFVRDRTGYYFSAGLAYRF